jgi:hypothetical protein
MSDLAIIIAVLGVLELVRYFSMHSLKKEILTRLVKLEYCVFEVCKLQREREEGAFLQQVRERYMKKPTEMDAEVLKKTMATRF